VPFQLAVAQKEAEIQEAEAQVAADQDAIASAQAAYSSAAATLALARVTQERTARLTSSGDASRQALDQASAMLQRAEADLSAAQASIDHANAMRAVHQAAQSRAQAERATAQWELARTQVLAPVDGTVTDLTVRPGDTAQQNVPLVAIVDAHAWRIIANYKQSYIRDFEPGHTAWVWLDSEPWHLHRARIGSVARGISREAGPAAAAAVRGTDH
jgi:multidrug efflux system membrane fusion protein